MEVRAAELWWVIGVTVAAGVVAAGLGHGSDVLLGTAAPALVAAVSWLVMTRTWSRAPEALLPMMLKAFPAKVVFFVGYAAVVLGVLEARAVPFVVSFAVAFLVTHLTEAFCLRRLLAPVMHDRSRGRR